MKRRLAAAAAERSVLDPPELTVFFFFFLSSSLRAVTPLAELVFFSPSLNSERDFYFLDTV